MTRAYSFVLRGPQLEGLELILTGLLPDVSGYGLPGGVSTNDSSLPLLKLSAPEVLSVGDEVSLCDPDNTPLARMILEGLASTAEGGAFVSGRVDRLRSPEHGPARDFRLHAGSDLSGWAVAVFSPGVTPAEVLSAVERAGDLPLQLIGEGAPDRAASTQMMRALTDAAAVLGGARVHYVPAAELGEGIADPTAAVLEGLGAKELLDFRRETPGSTRGAVVLFTGLSGAGKSTVARAVAERITAETDHNTVLLDGDDLRNELASELGFSPEGRHRNLVRQAWVAARVAEAGGLAICAPIAPFAASRAAMRAKVEPDYPFVLVHVATPLAVAESRDRKGLYAKARAGEILDFTGIDSPYEDPEDADLVIDTSVLSVSQCVDQVVAMLLARNILRIH